MTANDLSLANVERIADDLRGGPLSLLLRRSMRPPKVRNPLAMATHAQQLDELERLGLIKRTHKPELTRLGQRVQGAL